MSDGNEPNETVTKTLWFIYFNRREHSICSRKGNGGYGILRIIYITHIITTGAVAFSAEQNHAKIKTIKKTAFAIDNTVAKAVFR